MKKILKDSIFNNLKPLIIALGALGFLFPNQPIISETSFLFCLKPQVAPFEINRNNDDFVVDNEENLLEIPVSYGGTDGPDLHNISKILKLREDEIIEIHSGTKYHVFMIGFSPGFPYLGGLDERLECPRLPTPRITIPAGSVGIADKQTGIYPLESPGGWRIIGRTSLKLVDLKKKNFSLIKPGMKIKFKPL